MANTQKVVNSIHKKVQVINRTQAIKKFIVRGGSVAMIVLILLFGSFSLAQKSAGNFQVNIGEGNAAISMSEKADFKETATKLFVPFPSRFTNISYTDLPLETLGSEDGQHNGIDFMQYTFYLKNESNVNIYCKRYMPILNVENELDTTLRIMIKRTIVYSGETELCYFAKAKTGTDNEAEKVFYFDDHAKFEQDIDTTPFVDNETAILDEVRNMLPGQIDKYTIVIWIEGSDADCTDEKRGGEVKLRLDFNAYLEDYDDEEVAE